MDDDSVIITEQLMTVQLVLSSCYCSPHQYCIFCLPNLRILKQAWVTWKQLYIPMALAEGSAWFSFLLFFFFFLKILFLPNWIQLSPIIQCVMLPFSCLYIWIWSVWSGHICSSAFLLLLASREGRSCCWNSRRQHNSRSWCGQAS